MLVLIFLMVWFSWPACYCSFECNLIALLDKNVFRIFYVIIFHPRRPRKQKEKEKETSGGRHLGVAAEP